MKPLETDRLLLRAWTLDDVEAAFAIFGDPEVTQWFGGGGFPEDLDAMRAAIGRWEVRYAELGKRGFGYWASEEKATGRVVGGTILKPLPGDGGAETAEVEIGWHLAQPYWGNGFASEAAERVIRYAAEEVRLPEVYAIVKPGNARSVAVTQRLRMEPLGRTTKYYDGLEADLFVRRFSP